MDTKTTKAKLAKKSSGSPPTALTIIENIEKIVELTKDKKLTEENIESCAQYTTFVAERLSITAVQALLFAIFIDNSDDEFIGIKDLARHFTCQNIKVICYSEDILTLVEKGYVRKRVQSRKVTYRVPAEVLDALKKNKTYRAPSLERLDIKSFFNTLNRLFDEREGEELEYEDFCEKLNELLEGNPHLLISKKINEYSLDDDDMMLLFLFCHKFVNENDDCLGWWDFKDLYATSSDLGWIRNQLQNDRHTLQKKELIETQKGSDLVKQDMYTLSHKAKEELLSELNLELEEKAKPKNIVVVGDIVEKTLYYNSHEEAQIEQLVSLLSTDSFAKVQRRLTQNGMRKGFACLFYGAPGTGKTETVYQIARLTGRDIMYVNISDIKSMWVGESEKNIKALFDRYRNFCKQSTNTPILLFNEADALIGIRQEGAERAVDKMENSIQNIILQEMELLDGIMIATTNLTQNLDLAFERRFLFKIEFDKPGLEAKTAIWRSMLPALSESSASELAETYNFSGGQIENIARKETIDYIIQGKRPSVKTIHGYCKSELINNNNKERRPIGF